MKALIYARQSSGKDDFSESVEAQIANCKKLAAKEKLEVIGIYKDLNSSGETYPVGTEDIARLDKAYMKWAFSQSAKKDFRLGLCQVLQKLPEVDFVLVNELTRLYRPINGSFLESHINQHLKENNVKVLQVQGGTIDLSEFDQQLITLIKNQILYEDLQKKRQNSINAFRIKKDSGRLCSDAKMHGIRYLGNGKLEVIPEWVEIIRFVYDNICAYRPYRAIIRDCNERWGKDIFFYESSIYAIAKQPIYCGYQYNSQGELIKNVQITGQEFISFEQWQEVQKIISQKRKDYHVKAKKHWLPLSGKLYCGECGSKLICQLEHGKIYYSCNKRTLDRSHVNCRNSRIRFESGLRGEPALYDAVYPLLSIALIERHRKALEILNDKNELEKYDVELKNLAIKEEQLHEIFLDGLATEEQLRNLLIRNRSRRLELQKKVTLLKNSNLNKDALQDLEKNVLVGHFNDLANRSLPQGVYERLLNDARITATIYVDRVEFHTLYGNVSLPRIRSSNRIWMPKWELSLLNTGRKKQYGIDENTQITAIYFTGIKAELADFGNLRIVSR